MLYEKHRAIIQIDAKYSNSLHSRGLGNRIVHKKNRVYLNLLGVSLQVEVGRGFGLAIETHV